MKFIMRLNLMRTNCLKLIPLCVCAAAKKEGGLDALGEGLKSIYILSLLQTYVDTKNQHRILLW